MATAILAGLTNPQIQRIKAALRANGTSYSRSWHIEYFAAPKNQPEIAEIDIPALLSKAAAAHGAHIIGISKQDGAIRGRIRNRIGKFFRFVWLNNELLSHIGPDTQSFIAAINAILTIEDCWEQQVKPKKVDSPLVLPDLCFSSNVNMWELAEQYGDINNINGAAMAIQRFHSTYWRATSPTGHHKSQKRWIDDKDLVFDHLGARHGGAPFPRNWKYSFLLEENFHFDVTKRSEEKFAIRDSNNTVHHPPLGGHVNIDSHGWSI